MNDQSITVRLRILQVGNISLLLLLFYYTSRRSLWNFLTDFTSVKDPWSVLGDFIAVLGACKKIGQPLLKVACEDFRMMIENANLVQVDSEGPLFTWIRMQSVWFSQGLEC